MHTVEDFTSLPVGFLAVSEGRVESCPRCGRNGVLKLSPHDSAELLFIHRQETDVFGDGMLVEPCDCCLVRPA